MIAMISFESAAAKMLTDRDSLRAALVARTARMADRETEDQPAR